MFRNLSVKVFAEFADNAPVCDCCSYVFQCADCSECTDGATAPPECGECTDGATVPPECGECTDELTAPCEACTDFETTPECGNCTDGPTDDCFPCTDFEGTGGCLDPTIEDCFGDTCMEDTHCIHTLPILLPPPDDRADGVVRVVRPAAQVRTEMDLLKRELRAAMTLDPDVEPPGSTGRAQTLEEIEGLRRALVDAVAELDEQARTLRGEPPA